MLAGELRRQKTLFAVTEAAALAGAIKIAWVLRDPFGHSQPLRPGQQAELFGVIVALVMVWVFAARAMDLYRLHKSGLDELLAIIRASSVAWLAVVILIFFAHIDASRLAVGLAYLFSIALIVGARVVTRRCIKRFYANPAVAIPVVIVGANPFARYVRDRIVEELSQYAFLGFIDHNALDGNHDCGEVLGGLEQIPVLAGAHGNLEAAVVLPDLPKERVQEILELCERHDVRWRVMPPLFGSLTNRLKVDMVGVIPLMGPRNSNLEGLNYVIKRAFDFVAALGLLVLFSPVMLLAALALWLFDGRPLLFRQTRIGLHGRPFEVLKFRTMCQRCSDDVHREYVKGWIRQTGGGAEELNRERVFKLSADPRITRVGRWLRKFSIDELPQLINVLRGEMSLIGPRPALPYELDFYHDWHRHRLHAPPGITGLWQVSGRNRLPFDQMVQLDIEYIEDWSFARDLRILLRTVPVLFEGGGL